MVDAHAGIETRNRPQAGSRTICAYCATVMVFVEGPSGLTVRPATDEEVAELRGKYPGALDIIEQVVAERRSGPI